MAAELFVGDERAGEVKLVGIAGWGGADDFVEVPGTRAAGFLLACPARSPELKAVTQSGSASM